MPEELDEPRYSSDLPYPADDLQFCAMSEQNCTNMPEPAITKKLHCLLVHNRHKLFLGS